MKEVLIEVLTSPLYITTIIVNITLITAIALTIVELKKRKQEKNTEEEPKYLMQFNLIKKLKKTPRERLDMLNALAKIILSEKYQIDPKTTYEDLKNYEQNSKISEFANNMINSYYINHNLKEQDIKNLLEQLISLNKSIRSNPTPPLKENEIRRVENKIKEKIINVKIKIEKPRPEIRREIQKIKIQLSPEKNKKTKKHSKKKAPTKRKHKKR